MSKVYSAQNFAAYIIYELNETNTFVNAKALQHLLEVVKRCWENVFGSNPYREESYSTYGWFFKKCHYFFCIFTVSWIAEVKSFQSLKETECRIRS